MVAPFVGVWIEIEKMQKVQKDTTSLPSWECGLKLMTMKTGNKTNKGRSLRGSVD